MTMIRGVPGALTDAAAAYQNNIEDDRRAIWDWAGQTQGILYGFTHTLDGGALTITFAAGSAIIEQRGTDINGDGCAYHVTAFTNTVVPFDAPSASSRSDALVFAWVDPQYGSPGAGLSAGPQIIVVKGTSGSVVARTDAQIQTAVGVGGWFRYADVIIAPGNTSVQAGNFTDVHPSVRQNKEPKVTVINASGNFTRADRPAASGAWVRVWGAGAGGGAGDGDGGGQAESGGGGGGEYREKWYTGAAWAALARTFAVTVGTGGAGGVGGVGTDGGNSVFDTITSEGGNGGATGINSTTNVSVLGGLGGNGGSGGDLAIRGFDGGNGIVRGGIPIFQALGGASPNGGGTVHYPNFGAGNGIAGQAPGGGGSGCYAASAVDRVGGAGANGRIVVVEYF